MNKSKSITRLAYLLCGLLVLCFYTEEGWIPIEEIQPGMLVLATNTATGETAYKPVVRTFVSTKGELVHVKVNGESISATPEHPFYVPKKGWTSAVDLKAGDRLQLSNGEIVVVEAVQHEILEGPVKVYNFEVEDFHTYYVGSNGVLVHNACEQYGEYLSGKAPNQVTPGIRQLEGQYIDDLGRVQPWKAYYDEYGRLIARTDYNAGNPAAGIPDTHYHTYEWGPGMTPKETGSHIEGEYIP